MKEGFYPKEENIGRECTFYNNTDGCQFPKAEIIGRWSCLGIIDNICILQISKKDICGLDPNLKLAIKTRQVLNKDLPSGTIY